MKKYTAEELSCIVEEHGHWLQQNGGKRADLAGANLSGADLSGADLAGANLSGADLSGANLSGADLSGANLARAYLSGADLSGADLPGADLARANLSGADLSGANISEVQKARLMSCPESGAFDAFKKCAGGIIVKLRIPAKAKRCSATGRKCRAEFVKVLEVYGADEAKSMHDNGQTVYRKGETVKCDKWEEDRWHECAGGIHFFITRAEAEAY
jgi:hypothetical protein